MTQEEKSKQLYEKLLPLLQNGNEVEIYPSGTSMFPLINPPNDSVVLRSIKDTRLKSGDIILYRRESGLLVLHRLWLMLRPVRPLISRPLGTLWRNCTRRQNNQRRQN